MSHQTGSHLEEEEEEEDADDVTNPPKTRSHGDAHGRGLLCRNDVI